MTHKREKRLFISGATGFIGGHLCQLFSKEHKVFAGVHRDHHVPLDEHIIPTPYSLDDRRRLQTQIEKIQPDIIIHAAAKTNAQFCFRNQEEARQVNIIGTENIAQVAESMQARFIYLSTDLVFSGNEGLYSRKTMPHPICYYGLTKLRGEEGVKNSCSNYCILRIALAYGWSKTNNHCFTETMIDNCKKDKKISLFYDEYRSPLFVKDCAEMVLRVASRHDVKGLYLCGGPERISRADFGVHLVNTFNFPEELIERKSSTAMDFEEPRPLDCSMISDELYSIIDFTPRSCREGLKDMAEEYPDIKTMSG